jgi:hypothetical protein
VNDLVDPPVRDADVLSQPVLADAQRQEELLPQDFTGVDRRQDFSCHFLPSRLMVVHNLHILGEGVCEREVVCAGFAYSCHFLS